MKPVVIIDHMMMKWPVFSSNSMINGLLRWPMMMKAFPFDDDPDDLDSPDDPMSPSDG